MKTKILAAIAGVALAAAPANAVITGIVLSNAGTVTASAIIAAPADVQALSGQTFFGFTERSNVVTTGTGAARASGLGSPSFSSFVGFSAGTVLSSHFFVFAPSLNGQTVSGTISFNQPIVALQRTHQNMNGANNVQLRAAGTSYNLLQRQGTESQDFVTFLNANTVAFSLGASVDNQDNKDMFSIITAVPESPTWVMLIAGFGLVGFSARRRRVVAA